MTLVALPLCLAACALPSSTPHESWVSPCEWDQLGQKNSVNWRQIGPDIWLHQAALDALSTPTNGGHISNVSFVLDRAATGTRGWLVGSGPSARIGQALACSIRQQLGFQVTDVISPRAHPESVLGAAGLQNVRHWALPEVKVAMASRCARCQKRLEAAVNAINPLADTVSLPDHLIDGSQLGPFDVLPVEMQAQQSIAVLHHRASGIWILPGLVWGSDTVPDLREADSTQMINAINKLRDLKPHRIVPEQGADGDGSLIARDLAYWKRLMDALNSRWSQGENQPGSASGLTPTEWAQLPESAQLRDQLNVQRVWQQIENKGFRD